MTANKDVIKLKTIFSFPLFDEVKRKRRIKMMNLMKNDRKMQKILQKIWSCQKKVVILQAFSRERV